MHIISQTSFSLQGHMTGWAVYFRDVGEIIAILRFKKDAQALVDALSGYGNHPTMAPVRLDIP